MYHLGAMMLVRIALIIHDNGAIVCIVRKQVGRHGIGFKAERRRKRVLIGWEGKVLLTFIMVTMY